MASPPQSAKLRKRRAGVNVIALFDSEPAAWDGVLYRALRDDVRFRFAAISGGGDVVRELGTPDVEGGVVLIEPFFEVPGDADDAFVAAWERLRSARAQQRGYLGSRLYAEPRFVDFTRWSSPLMYARALKLAQVQEAVAAMPFPSHPALYLELRR
jgi:hypothetical protein